MIRYRQILNDLVKNIVKEADISTKADNTNNKASANTITNLARLKVDIEIAKLILDSKQLKQIKDKRISISLIDLVRSFNRVTTKDQLLAILTCILYIVTKIFLKIPDMKDTGYRLKKIIVEDERLAKYVRFKETKSKDNRYTK